MDAQTEPKASQATEREDRMSEQVTEQTQEAPSPAIAGASPHPSAAQAVEGSADRDAPEGPGKLVPVNEAIKYRRRAQQAESRLQQVEQQLNDVRTQFEERLEQLATADAARDEMQHQLEAVRARASAEGALYGAGVVDIEAASALLEKRLSFDDELDAERLAQAVDQLLQDKPFLLAPAVALPDKTASARPREAGMGARLARAASQAVSSGSRRDVADYLRLRRQTQNA